MKILSKNELESVSGGVGFFQALGALAKSIYCGSSAPKSAADSSLLGPTPYRFT